MFSLESQIMSPIPSIARLRYWFAHIVELADIGLSQMFLTSYFCLKKAVTDSFQSNS